jgi:hypothetical protein
MGLLSVLLTRSFKRPGKHASASLPERRAAERFETTLPVSLRKPGMSSFGASLINISMTGAAINLEGWDMVATPPWPLRLEHGEEITLARLLDAPLSAWVVNVNDAVIRVRFLLDDPLRAKLQTLIGKLAAAK